MPEKKEFLSIPEAAVLMGISRIAVFKKVKKGQLTAIRIGRNWAIPAAALGAQALTTPHKAEKIKTVIPPPSLTYPENVRPRPRAPVPEEPAPQKESMDDIGWD